MASSLIWYSALVLLPSQYSGNHLTETTNNYTFLLFFMSHSVGKLQMDGNSPFSSRVSCLVAMALQFLRLPSVTRMLILCRNITAVIQVRELPLGCSDTGIPRPNHE